MSFITKGMLDVGMPKTVKQFSIFWHFCLASLNLFLHFCAHNLKLFSVLLVVSLSTGRRDKDEKSVCQQNLFTLKIDVLMVSF